MFPISLQSVVKGNYINPLKPIVTVGLVKCCRAFPNCVHLVVSEGAFCGNKIVEAGEECDCGYDEEECTDKCCYPRLLNEKDRQRNSSASSCARKAGTQCRLDVWFMCLFWNAVNTRSPSVNNHPSCCMTLKFIAVDQICVKV